MPMDKLPRRAASSLTRQAFLSFLAPVLALAGAALAANAILETSKSEQRTGGERAELLRVHHRFLSSVEWAANSYGSFLLTGDTDHAEAFDAAMDRVDRHLERLSSYADDPGNDGHQDFTRKITQLVERWRSEVAHPLMDTRRQLPVGLAAESFILHARLNRLADRLSDDWDTTPASARENWRQAFHATVLRLRRIAQKARTTDAAARWATLSERATEADNRLDDVPDNVGVFRELITSMEARTRYLVEDTASDKLTLLERFRSGPGGRLIERIRSRTEEHITALEASQDQATRESLELTRMAQWITSLAPAGGLLLGLAVAMYLIYGVITDLRKVSRAARQVANGSVSGEVEVQRDDEIGELAASFNAMSASLAARYRIEEAFDNFESTVRSANTALEAVMAVQRFAATFFPGTTGQIYRMAESRNRLDRIGGWDDAATVSPPEEIEPDECLALRTGREHEWPQGQPPVPCPHHGDATPVESVCLPLLGRDQSMGLLTIARPDPDETDGVEPINFWLAHRVADQLGLVLANLELHERLRAQSIRDPLTSLFNRRYLDETLAREMERSRRESTPLAVIAMDIDHFKPYNDEYGHEAGDKVLQALAKALMGHVRDSDIACRAGGEEFILVLPTADADLAARRAEELRENVGGMVVAYGNTQLPPVTISAGVAALPPDPGDADSLLRAADRALYQAKRDGRNCVRRAGESG